MELQKRLNKTFQKVTRDRHVIAQRLKLSDSEYRLWDLFTALYDWDNRHTTFGSVVGTNEEIAKLLSGCNWSASKVCRTLISLIKKGLIKRVSRSQHKLTALPLDQITITFPSNDTPDDSPTLSDNILADPQNNNADPQITNAEMHQDSAELQENQGSMRISIVSFKDKFKDEKDGRNLTREEYEKVCQEVERLYSVLKGKFLSENGEIQKKVQEYERLAQLMLDYQIEHDLLPIGKDKT